MRNLKTLGRRAAAVTCAALLATSLMAPAAFADPAASESSGLAAAYKGTTYRVTVYSGNQGTFADGETQVVFEDQKPGDTFSFEGITLEVPESSKYYAKGVRLAALDNVRSDKNRDGKNIAGTETHLYANVAADGKLVGSAPITEDTDFVVAYGILANRVAYTVTYTDTEGNQLAEPQTFFGDIGDVPATAPAYIEGYVPDAALLTKTLVADESQNVFPFVYTKLASGQTTEQDPNTGDVTINTPNGPTGPIYNPNTGLPTITFPNLGGTDQGGTTTTTTGGATGAGTGAGAGTTAPAAAADAGAAATGAAARRCCPGAQHRLDSVGHCRCGYRRHHGGHHYRQRAQEEGRGRNPVRPRLMFPLSAFRCRPSQQAAEGCFAQGPRQALIGGVARSDPQERRHVVH